MDYIEEIHQKAKSQKQKASELIGELIIINSPNLLSLVRKRWLLGESVFGGFIGEYSNSQLGQDYKAYKLALNPLAGGKVDLTLTGALGDGLTIKKVTNVEYQIFSTDDKYKKIGSKYGFDEFGITDLEWMELEQEIFDFAVQTMLNRTYE